MFATSSSAYFLFLDIIEVIFKSIWKNGVSSISRERGPNLVWCKPDSVASGHTGIRANICLYYLSSFIFCHPTRNKREGGKNCILLIICNNIKLEALTKYIFAWKSVFFAFLPDILSSSFLPDILSSSFLPDILSLLIYLTFVPRHFCLILFARHF